MAGLKILQPLVPSIWRPQWIRRADRTSVCPGSLIAYAGIPGRTVPPLREFELVRDDEDWTAESMEEEIAE
jgi:hypothetical protein